MTRIGEKLEGVQVLEFPISAGGEGEVAVRHVVGEKWGEGNCQQRCLSEKRFGDLNDWEGKGGYVDPLFVLCHSLKHKAKGTCGNEKPRGKPNC